MNALIILFVQLTSLLPMEKEYEVATLGGGCFWCTEAVYEKIEGVQKVVSGYSGGSKADADYEKVASGRTQHAEVIQITFDPDVVDYAEILEIFWVAHDPTTLNRQGNDVGPQYRSVIFYHSEEQREKATRSIKEVATTIWDTDIVTQLEPFQAFYEAEDYHQDYYEKVGARNPYCTFVITPKLKKINKIFSDKLKNQ
jgi:peptide-methionine (S)-S-oxide reductase